ncbi:MAG: response regulator [Candidatus Methylomirabilales bacterium]
MTPARILLVDDEEEILRLLTRCLRRQGYQVTTATSSHQALALLQEAAFDVAIVDYMMPGMNGLELAGHGQRRQPALKILMLTGSPLIAEIEAAGYACLRKPLENLQGLDQAIERLLAAEGEETTA